MSLIMLGQIEANLGELKTGVAQVREAVHILRELGAAGLDQAESILEKMEAARQGGVATGRGPAQTDQSADVHGPDDEQTGARGLMAAFEAAANALRAGDADEALQQATTPVDCLGEAAAPQRVAMAQALIAQALAAKGRFDEALETVESALSAAAGAGESELAELRGLQDHLRGAGELERLATTPVAELREQTSQPSKLAGLLAAKATATLAADRPDEARTLFAEAVTVAEQSGNPVARLDVLIHRCQFELSTGAAAAARATIKDARAIATEHARQALPLLEQLEQALAGRPHRDSG